VGKRITNFALLFLIISSILPAQENMEPKENTVDTSVKISGQWFMAYRGNIPSEGDDSFGLKRGYLTFKKNLNDNFSIRYTQDITIDKEGDDAGNVEIRFKYCYLKADLPDLLFFKYPFVEIGLVHRPWIEFEQKINTYRVQGKMFLDKYGVVGSADFGVNVVALLGGQLDDEARKKADSSLPGKYGSVSLGVYNGGGYYAIEQNNNKTFEGRLTLRPFPGFMPGLQFSYGFASGQGNDTLNTQFNYNIFFISHETAKTTLTAQFYSGRGFHGGGSDKLNAGYSYFGEICVPLTPLTVFGRFDHFIDGTNFGGAFTPPYNIQTNAYIAGLAWKFYKKNRLILDIEKNRSTVLLPFSMPGVSKEELIAELALEIVF